METEEENNISKLNEQVKSVTREEDIKEDMFLETIPNINWEHYLIPAPMSIALLGELIFITNDTDFSLEKAKPEKGFQYIRYPSSFYASLAQVTNAGWDAFNEAHKIMDQIRLHSANVPVYLDESIKILTKGTSKDIKNFLPISLEGIKDIADRCLNLAISTEERFTDVMNLTGEILEACTFAKMTYEEDLRETKVQLQIIKDNQKTIEEERSMARDQLEDIKKEIESAEKLFEEVMKSFPGGLKLTGISFAESIANGVKNFVNGIFSAFSRKEKKKIEEEDDDLTKRKTQSSEFKMDEATRKSLNRACSKAEIIQHLAQKLQFLVYDDDSLDKEELRRGDTEIFVACYSRRICKEINTECTSLLQMKAVRILNKMIGICKDLENIKKDFQVNQTKLIVDRIREINGEAMEFVSESKEVLCSTAIDRKLPMQYSIKGYGKYIQSGIEIFKFKLEHATQHLETVKESYASSYEKLVDANKRQKEDLAEMAKLNIKELNFEQIKETLRKGLKAFGEVRHQWGMMIQFFQLMSNVIKCTFSISLNKYIKYVGNEEYCGLEGYDISDFMKEMIYQQTFEAAKIAYVVNSISGVYVEVSSKCIMNRLASLGSLLGLDAEKDKEFMGEERKKLHNECKDAQEQIQTFVLKEKEKLYERIDRRISQLKQNLNDAFPMVSVETSNRIQKSVEAGISASKEWTL